MECRLSRLLDRHDDWPPRTQFSKMVEDLQKDPTTADSYLALGPTTLSGVPIVCGACGRTSVVEVSISWADELFLYIEEYVKQRVEDILQEAGGLRISQLEGFAHHFALTWAVAAEAAKSERYRHLRLLFLLEFKQKLPILGGRGAGWEELPRYLQDVALGVIASVVFEVLKYGAKRAFGFVRNWRALAAAKKQIRESISKINFDYVSVEDLARYVSTRKDLNKADRLRLVNKIAVRHARHVRQSLHRMIEEHTGGS